jgi:L-asparaginase
VGTQDGRARVAVLTLGGTIAMTSQGKAGATPQLSAADLLAAVPGLDDVPVDLEVHEFRRVPGASLSYGDLLDLAREIQTLDVDGVVVTQGTDTIEETAYLLHLVHEGQAPVVVTGAMRNASQAGADGPANILAAVRVAADPASRHLGGLVVFGEEIHAAEWVRKTHSSSPTAFTSYPGPIGYVAEDRVVISSRPRERYALPIPQPTRPARTAIATLTLGDDGAVLEALGSCVDGLVVAAFGVGHAPAACLEALTALATRRPVVLASRTGSGPVLRSTYGFPGSESDLLARGLISAGSLPPVKANVLLRLILSSDSTSYAVRGLFAQFTAPSTPR